MSDTVSAKPRDSGFIESELDASSSPSSGQPSTRPRSTTVQLSSGLPTGPYARPRQSRTRSTTRGSEDEFPWKNKPEDRYPTKDSAKYTEFEKRYPPDRYGEEAGEDARVWKVYRERASEKDEDVIEGWNSLLDILLIFAGLFSAIATGFIIESYKTLQQDPSEYMAMALYILVTRPSDSSAQLPPPNDFKASLTPRWVNGLWFMSLALSLCVALLSILVKQWLGEYQSRMRSRVASQRQWARRRRAYHSGMSKWKLDAFISTLPVMLHASLFLFLAGLVLFLVEIDATLAWLMLWVSTSLFTFYVVVTLLPLWCGDCPTATPLLRQVHAIYRNTAVFIRRMWRLVVQRCRSNGWKGKLPDDDDWHAEPAFHESRLLGSRGPELDVNILASMVKNLPAKEDTEVALAAIGSLDVREHGQYFHSLKRPLVIEYVRHKAITYFKSLSIFDRQDEQIAAKVAAALRTLVFLGLGPRFSYATRLMPDIGTHDLYILRQAHIIREDDQELGNLAAQLESWWAKKESGHDGSEPGHVNETPVHPSTLSLVLAEETYSRSAKEALGRLSISQLAAISYCLDNRLSSLLPGDAAFTILITCIKNSVEARTSAGGIALSYEPLQTEHQLLREIHAWSFALVNGSAIGVTNAAVVRRSFAASLAQRRATWYKRLPYTLWDAERCVVYIGTDDFMKHSWSVDALAGAADLLEGSSLTDADHSRSIHWSKHMGNILFNLLQLYSDRAAEAQELIKYAQNLMNWLADVIGHHDGLLDVHHHADDTEDKLQHDFINLLAPRPANGRSQPTSAWQLACSMYEDRIGSLTGVALALMVRLVRMVGRGEATREELDGHFHQLVGNDIALSLVLANTHAAFDLVAHARKFSPEWWDNELRKQLLELPTVPQRPDIKARGATNRSEPAQFVRDIDAATVCDDLPETQDTGAGSSASGDHMRFSHLFSQAQAIFSLGQMQGQAFRSRRSNGNEVDIEAGRGREAESSQPGGEKVANQA